MLDRFDCYELCVQSPRHLVALLRGAHGGEPLVLREEFCGTAAVSRRWAAEGAKRGDRSRAVAVDIDQEPIARAIERAREEGLADRLVLRRGDVLDGLVGGRVHGRPEPQEGQELRLEAGTSGQDERAGRPLHSVSAQPPEDEAADVVFIGNFSIGYIHDRRTLIAYLARARERLARGSAGWGGGILACDTYGGHAFRLGGFTRRHPGRGPELIHYTWRRERADPIAAMVENSISFRVEIGGEVVAEMPRAFVYRWRLWSIAELREAMLEAGFASVEVYQDTNIEPGGRPVPVGDPQELGEDWIVLVIGRAQMSRLGCRTALGY